MYHYIKTNVTNQNHCLPDLPRYFQYSNDFSFKLWETYTGLLSSSFCSNNVFSSLENALSKCLALNSTCTILVVQSSGLAVINKHNSYLLFDPHSCGIDALRCPDGVAALSTFTSLTGICSHIRKLTQSITSVPLEQTQFDLHLVSVRKILQKSFRKKVGKVYCSIPTGTNLTYVQPCNTLGFPQKFSTMNHTSTLTQEIWPSTSYLHISHFVTANHNVKCSQ